MINFYGSQPPGPFQMMRLGGKCPQCAVDARWTLITHPDFPQMNRDQITKFVVCYACDACLGPVPVEWRIKNWPDPNNPEVEAPTVVVRSLDSFEFDHVPGDVRKEIEEALDCLSVGAYNGFASVCRRAVQAICTNLGADATDKVEKQITEMAELAELGDDGKKLAIQIMLSGHDGAHPHLPDIDEERASVLLSLLEDLTYQLYTRPGRVKKAAALRKRAIEQKKAR